MMLTVFAAVHAKDVVIRFVTVFVVGLLLALSLSWLVPYQIDASHGFVRGALKSIGVGGYAAALIFGFLLSIILAVVPLVVTVMRRMWRAIDAGRFDQSKIKISPIYVAVLVAAVMSYSLYLAGTVVSQTILPDSLFGYLFAYQIYTSVFLLCVCDLVVALKLRFRAGAGSAVK